MHIAEGDTSSSWGHTRHFAYGRPREPGVPPATRTTAANHEGGDNASASLTEARQQVAEAQMLLVPHAVAGRSSERPRSSVRPHTSPAPAP